MVIFTPEELDVLCISQMMLVRNNSKHTKAKRFVRSDDATTEDPKTFNGILAISPSEDWLMGGQTIVIIEDNFCHSL